MAPRLNAAKEAGRYRKVYPRIWRHPRFRTLKPAARELTLYLLCGPQTNAIGLFSFSLGAAAEDLGVGHETLVDRFGDVRQTFGWHYDPDARVIFIPSWWRWNRPENANVLRGNMKLLSEIPPTPLADLFAKNIETLPETLWETFAECCRERIGRHSTTQEQEQDQKQDQEKHGACAQNGATSRLAPKNGSDEDIMPIARRVLTLTSGPIDHLVDTLLSIKPSTIACNRAKAIQLMNEAIAERRRHGAVQ